MYFVSEHCCEFAVLISIILGSWNINMCNSALMLMSLYKISSSGIISMLLKNICCQLKSELHHPTLESS